MTACAPHASGTAASEPSAADLEALDLEAELRRCVFTPQSSPACVRGALRQVLQEGLRLIREARSPQKVAAGWKLFLRAPCRLFCRSRGETRVEPAELARRVEQLAARQWLALLAAAAAQTTLQGRPPQTQRLAPPRGCWGRPWSGPPHACAAKPAHVLPPTSFSATCHWRIPAGSKCWQMDCQPGKEPRSPLTERARAGPRAGPRRANSHQPQKACCVPSTCRREAVQTCSSGR